jgi:hypothetical protein
VHHEALHLVRVGVQVAILQLLGTNLQQHISVECLKMWGPCVWYTLINSAPGAGCSDRRV